jgi:putative ABC transport system substrate-binding protein
MNRRDAIKGLLTLGAIGSPWKSGAQDPKVSDKTLTLGVLSALPILSADKWAASPFWAPLRKLGWIEGQNLRVERASAEGEAQRLPDLARVLVSKGVDVLFAPGNESAIAAAQATKTIPIVFWGVNYPVEMGLAKSLPRPEGNVTGIALFVGPSESAKTLDFIRELLPAAGRISYLYEGVQIRRVDGSEWPVAHNFVAAAAKARGFEAIEVQVDRSEDLDAALNRIAQARTQALYVAYSQLTIREAARIFAFANRIRLPSVMNVVAHRDAGILSYGPDLPLLFQRAAAYVDKVLRGASPADLPIELPTKFNLYVNLKAAKEIGLGIPKSLLVRANLVN